MLSPFFEESRCTQRTTAEREAVFLPTYKEFIERALTITKLSDGETRALEKWVLDYIKSLDDPTFRQSHRRRTRLLKDVVQPSSGKRILDVGCSVGTNLLELSECGGDCYGVDLTLPFVKVLKGRAKCLSL
jgi:2-polyprenyl-3-methyl-5-hydroxy-6-metoxy-1,4-benzoquinol methylase